MLVAVAALIIDKFPRDTMSSIITDESFEVAGFEASVWTPSLTLVIPDRLNDPV